MYSLFLSGDRPVIYCVAGWTGAGTLRTAALQDVTTKLHIERSRADVEASADSPNYQEFPPLGVSIGILLLLIAGSLGFYLEETSSSTLCDYLCS